MLVTMIIISVPGSPVMAQSGGFKTMLNILLKGDVPQVMVDSSFKHISSFTILDAREEKEYNVSHIEGALYTGYKNLNMSRLNSMPRNSKILVYCSVGKRSEDVGRKLIDAGFTNVYNLYGGIFEWVNEGHPVVDVDGKLTHNIHAYNRMWGTMLHKGNKVF